MISPLTATGSRPRTSNGSSIHQEGRGDSMLIEPAAGLSSALICVRRGCFPKSFAIIWLSVLPPELTKGLSA